MKGCETGERFIKAVTVDESSASGSPDDLKVQNLMPSQQHLTPRQNKIFLDHATQNPCAEQEQALAITIEVTGSLEA